VSDHWFARDYGKQFIEPHALAAATGHENCAEHSWQFNGKKGEE